MPRKTMNQQQEVALITFVFNFSNPCSRSFFIQTENLPNDTAVF